MSSWRRLDPARVLVASFAIVIALGAWALRQPWAAQPGRQLSWAEALFTSTSATCVTGLIVRMPGDHTVAGQAVIAILIQVGGLGIMTFGLFFVVLVGGRLSLFGRELLMSSLVHGPWEDFWPLLRTVIVATGAVEAAGAGLLAAGWWHELSWRAIPWGVFHSVSAFCNAGFGLHPASLAPWRDSATINLTIGILIIAGGLGFLPATELLQRWRHGVRRPLSLHVRTVLTVTGTLLVIGWAGFAMLEWRNTLAGLSAGERLLAVWLQGIVPRTAGFSSLDFGAMNPATLLFTIVLMFIGASPGSTGGGVKTATLGVLVAVLVARVRARKQVTLFKRGIGDATVATAFVVLVLSLCVVVGGTLLVLAIEHGTVGGSASRAASLAETFDVVSAFGTVGLSTGITPSLSVGSWLALVLVMFVGRVGPLTLGLALAGRRPRTEPTYAEEDLLVG
jgi:trk system potassium uptake protein TrkH